MNSRDADRGGWAVGGGYEQGFKETGTDEQRNVESCSQSFQGSCGIVLKGVGAHVGTKGPKCIVDEGRRWQ